MIIHVYKPITLLLFSVDFRITDEIKSTQALICVCLSVIVFVRERPNLITLCVSERERAIGVREKREALSKRDLGNDRKRVWRRGGGMISEREVK